MKSRGAYLSSKRKGKICPRVFSSKTTPHLNNLRREASLHDTIFRCHLSASIKSQFTYDTIYWTIFLPEANAKKNTGLP